jgi:hypothetical protein
VEARQSEVLARVSWRSFRTTGIGPARRLTTSCSAFRRSMCGCGTGGEGAFTHGVDRVSWAHSGFAGDRIRGGSQCRATRLGHASASMALDRYGQLLGGDLGAVAEQRLDAADRQADVPSEPRRPSRPSRGAELAIELRPHGALGANRTRDTRFGHRLPGRQPTGGDYLQSVL